MSFEINALNNLHIDVLREIGNIGAGNAATALANLLNKRVEMAVPKVNILEFKEVSELLGGADTLFAGVLLNVTGDLTGNILFMLNFEEAKVLLEMLMGPAGNDCEGVLDEMQASALMEVGNILAGSYLSALSNLTNLRIVPSVPSLAVDMAGAILSVPAIEFGKVGDTVLYIETEFKEGEHQVIGDFFLIPDIESYDILLRALGVNN